MGLEKGMSLNMEYVIVTVMSNINSKYYDVGLPVNIPGKALVDKILSLIKTFDMDFSRELKGERVHLENLGRFLADDETLWEAGVWDGSMLKII